MLKTRTTTTAINSKPVAYSSITTSIPLSSCIEEVGLVAIFSFATLKIHKGDSMTFIDGDNCEGVGYLCVLRRVMMASRNFCAMGKQLR